MILLVKLHYSGDRDIPQKKSRKRFSGFIDKDSMNGRLDTLIHVDRSPIGHEILEIFSSLISIPLMICACSLGKAP